MKRPRAFCEFPAGLASVSLRLHGGPDCRPPISRMGNKAGFSGSILGALGLRSGQGAGAYLWAEADPDVAALLRAYPDPEMLRRVAEIIRGWKDEEPRALWERLRAERKERETSVDGLAGWIVSTGWTRGDGRLCVAPGACPDGTNPAVSPGGITDRCLRLAEYAAPTDAARERFEGVARKVAGHILSSAWAAHGKDLESYHGPGHHPCPTWTGESSMTGRADAVSKIASNWPPVAVLRQIPTAAEVAEWLGTPGDLEDVVIYKDPDYVGTTGYKDTYPRVDVVRNAVDFASLGAVVCVSEAEALPELVALGWEATEITGGRKGQKRTFARVSTEWLTMNRPPVLTVAKQVGLFG